MQAKQPEQRGISKHTLIMLLCCLIPLAIFATLWATGTVSPSLTLAVVLLCPLLHVIMMLGMRKGGGESSGHQH